MWAEVGLSFRLLPPSFIENLGSESGRREKKWYWHHWLVFWSSLNEQVFYFLISSSVWKVVQGSRQPVEATRGKIQKSKKARFLLLRCDCISTHIFPDISSIWAQKFSRDDGKRNSARIHITLSAHLNMQTCLHTYILYMQPFTCLAYFKSIVYFKCALRGSSFISLGNYYGQHCASKIVRKVIIAVLLHCYCY